MPSLNPSEACRYMTKFTVLKLTLVFFLISSVLNLYLLQQSSISLCILKMAYSSLGQNPTVISHNVRGLNIPERRTTLLRELRKGKPKFVFLQETHFKTAQVPRLTDSYFPEAYHATNNLAKSKGVSILISKHASFDITDKLLDPEGRFIFLKGKCDGMPLMLANVYFPNSSHLTFCRNTLSLLQGFSSGCIILGGDFNIPLNPLADTSTERSSITYRILKGIKAMLGSMQLIDSWRFTHPEDKDYTFHSPQPPCQN